MDGLMLDTECHSLELWPLAGQKFGVEITQETVMCIIGINQASQRSFFTGKFGRDFPYEQIHAEAGRLISEKIEREGIALKPGLLTLLDFLEKKRVPFAVATSTGRKTAEWKLSKAGIRERFPVIVCGDEIKNGKPAPDIFLAAAHKLSADPHACAGFEDSGPGLLGLHTAGIHSVFIRDLAAPSPEALATAWKQYKTLAEAVEIFV